MMTMMTKTVASREKKKVLKLLTIRRTTVTRLLAKKKLELVCLCSSGSWINSFFFKQSINSVFLPPTNEQTNEKSLNYNSNHEYKLLFCWTDDGEDSGEQKDDDTDGDSDEKNAADDDQSNETDATPTADDSKEDDKG